MVNNGKPNSRLTRKIHHQIHVVKMSSRIGAINQVMRWCRCLMMVYICWSIMVDALVHTKKKLSSSIINPLGAFSMIYHHGLPSPWTSSTIINHHQPPSSKHLKLGLSPWTFGAKPQPQQIELFPTPKRPFGDLSGRLNHHKMTIVTTMWGPQTIAVQCQ